MATYFIQNTNNVEDIEQMNNVINKVNKVNTEATSNIGQLTDLNNKAQELSNNINQALPLNSELVKNTEEAKTANTNLAAVNQEATTKNTELQASLEKTKEFIEGLDGSQNIPQLRLDVTELKNGLKSNQALSYEGSSIVANETLEGRTEDMKIKGRTLNNLYKPNNTRDDAGKYILVDTLVKDEPKDRVVYIVNNTNRILLLNVYKISGVWDSNPIIRENSISKLDLTGKKLTGFLGMYDRGWTNSETDKELLRNTCIVLDREETYIPQKYFEGLKSFGETEKVGDKYKISILSHGKNLCKVEEFSTIATDSSVESYSTLDKVIESNIEVDPNKTYTLSYTSTISGFNGCKLLGCNIPLPQKITRHNDAYVFCTNNGGQERSQKITGFKYITITTGGSVPANIIKVGETINIVPQLEEGSISTPYEPYKYNKKDILIKSPLREWDSMYEDNGQVKVYRDTRKYVITGNEDWAQYTDNRDFACMGFFLQLNKDFDAKLGGKFICNNFKGSDTDVFPGNITVDDEIIFVKGRSGEASPSYIKISILKSKLTTQNVEGFKEWLKANPTEIVYQLATPTVEIVENCVDIDLDTFGEKTYFNILNSLPGTLDFKVPSNLGSVVQNMAKEVNNIWDVINNLLVPSLIDINKNVAMSTIKNNLK